MNYNHTCIRCSNQFFRYSKHYRLNKRPKFCSENCRRSISKKQNNECLYCKNTFIFFKSVQPGIFCQKKCEVLYRKDPTVRFNKAKKYFESHIITHQNKCWEWTGPLRKGYPAMNLNRKSIGAHKFSWILYKGEIPNKLWVLHKCDIPTCTNPEHLFLGTPKDNMQDMIKKGRNKRPFSKINENDVLKIKSMIKSGINCLKISRDLLISKHIIYDIKRNKTWKHLNI